MNDKPIKILLVEDKPEDTRLIYEILAEARETLFDLECVDQLSTGLERLAAGGIDVILLDLLLPDSLGLDTLTKTKAHAPGAPIIVLTGLDDEELAVKAVQEGAQDYLVKGQVDGNLLARAIRYAIERKRIEDDLRRTQQQVIQQERLSALGQMASGIAHDFNNVLTPILGYCEILLAAPGILDDKEKMKHYLKQMNTAAEDAKNTVSRLREFYRHREEDEIFAPVNLNQQVKQAIELTQPRWKDHAQSNGITISMETDLQKVPVISGNESELRGVLINLILNAVDAMPNGGTTTIRTRHDGKYVRFAHQRLRLMVILEVSDTGVGMTEEVKKRCFEPFFSTKHERGGTGLGLAIVYGIINRHEGTIEIDSEPGKGTTFIIRLSTKIKQQDEEETQETAPSSRSLHVLVVDDNPIVRDVVTAYMAADGHTFKTATNGREGVEKFYKGRFDIVITDRAMPNMSGIQLAELIKQISPKAPVIMLTGFGDMMKYLGEMPAGVDCLISKPVTLNEFREALAKVIS